MRSEAFLVFAGMCRRSPEKRTFLQIAPDRKPRMLHDVVDCHFSKQCIRSTLTKGRANGLPFGTDGRCRDTLEVRGRVWIVPDVEVKSSIVIQSICAKCVVVPQ